MTYRTSLIVALGALAFGCHEDGHGHAGHGAPPPAASASGPPANAVQAEMRLLADALAGAVHAVGRGDVRGVEHDLHRVHGAKEATEAALKDGKYKPPKNADKLDRFRELDRSFHDELEKLVAASRANDVPGVAAATGRALGACQGCHSEFRL
ncbi:MAG: cytochrome c [Polyangiaceae bacterium]|nr:cytochrome c [Polyangiaceae bacterium]